MPKIKGVLFETAIIERYKRRETSVEEALIEIYLQPESKAYAHIEKMALAQAGGRISLYSILFHQTSNNLNQFRSIA